jgi:GMP synthase-like glutamine amidotransferase
MKWLKKYENFNTEKVLVVDNSKPPEKKYIENIIVYLKNRGIEYIVVDNIEDLKNVLESEKIFCAISSGSDYRVNEDNYSLATLAMDKLNCPLLGICFGMQTMALHYGAKVKSGTELTIGESILDNIKEHWLFEGVNLISTTVSFAFNDSPIDCPEGFEIHATINGKIAAILSDSKKRYGLLFHPENKIETFTILDNFTKR